ncbi:hypothetical protein LEP1GSC017_3680 [Leptospira meyeri serovar Hardjo str. Went 5]|uniref:hypothetical protein n=1 Tax=Leptospira meyeri TaxID=29508 RepID=UPI00028CF042|nr:hypothetical protein [Leptospira meyeri]EKJ85441.1 hypothetical protein LEP1GSC017_3680 [Leptospira meyeri serovar Hardjo str. Went 5]
MKIVYFLGILFITVNCASKEREKDFDTRQLTKTFLIDISKINLGFPYETQVNLYFENGKSITYINREQLKDKVCFLFDQSLVPKNLKFALIKKKRFNGSYVLGDSNDSLGYINKEVKIDLKNARDGFVFHASDVYKKEISYASLLTGFIVSPITFPLGWYPLYNIYIQLNQDTSFKKEILNECDRAPFLIED